MNVFYKVQIAFIVSPIFVNDTLGKYKLLFNHCEYLSGFWVFLLDTLTVIHFIKQMHFFQDQSNDHVFLILNSLL
jgi:hypothetical protein